MDFARYSDYRENTGRMFTGTERELADWFNNGGFDFERVVQDVRVGGQVPLLENALGPTWEAVSDEGMNVTWSYEDFSSGTGVSLKKPGLVVTSNYWADFDHARELLRRAIDDQSYSDLLSAITAGVASIGAFIAHRVAVYNNEHQEEPLLDDGPPYFTLDEKVKIWFPIMSGGAKYDCGRREWNDFVSIRKIRDEKSQHSKHVVRAVAFDDFVAESNLFTTAIAGTLYQMHRFFDANIPASIIRARYAGPVIITDERRRPQDHR